MATVQLKYLLKCVYMCNIYSTEIHKYYYCWWHNCASTCLASSFKIWYLKGFPIRNAEENFEVLYLPCSRSYRSTFCFILSGIWQASQCYKNISSTAFVSKVIKEIATAKWTQTDFSGYVYFYCMCYLGVLKMLTQCQRRFDIT